MYHEVQIILEIPFTRRQGSLSLPLSPRIRSQGNAQFGERGFTRIIARWGSLYSNAYARYFIPRQRYTNLAWNLAAPQRGTSGVSLRACHSAQSIDLRGIYYCHYSLCFLSILITLQFGKNWDRLAGGNITTTMLYAFLSGGMRVLSLSLSLVCVCVCVRARA